MQQTQNLDAVDELLRAVEGLRLAETRAVRHHNPGGLRGMDRAAAVHLQERHHAGHSVTPTSLARYLGISTAAVTHVIDRLTHASLVRRERSDTDRRHVTIHLTVPHDDPRLTDPLHTPLRDVITALDVTEQQTILHFLEDLQRLLPHARR